MVFSSVSFLVFFLPCLLVLYFIVPQRYRGARNLILLAFSLAFYACGGPKFLLLMLLSIAVNYCCGLLAGPKHRPAVRKTGVTLAVVLELGLLGRFKYEGFFGEMLHALMPFLPVPQVTLPIGISFFTFQGLSYVIDVFRDDAAVQKNPLKLALYISFFPQLVAGPIVRYTTVADEIDERQESVSEFSAGAVRFLFGLAKKMLLANAVAQVADAAFSAVSPSVALAWLGAVAYTFQIYFDFSAYSDMAIGLGRMFGFHFLENFNYPYVSRSITEFWRRWHISLGAWRRDYLFYPLALSKPFGRLAQFCRRHMPLDAAKCIVPSLCTFLVFLAVGVWQGPGMANIAYGLWNGFWMSLAMFRAPIRKHLRLSPEDPKKGALVWGVVRTNLLVIIGRYFSNASSLRSALGMLKQTVLHFGVTRVHAALFTELGFSLSVLWKVVPMLGVVFAVSFAAERGTDVARWLCERKWLVQFLILFVALLTVVLFVYGNAGYTPIAYVYENV